MISNVLYAVYITACLVILLMGLFGAINNMSNVTDLRIRLAWVLLTTGAFGGLAGVLYGHECPSIAEITMAAGASVFAAVDRRRYRKEAERAHRGTKIADRN